MNDYKLTISEIQENQFNSFYLISGEEVFFINKIVKSLTKKLVNDESKYFYHYILSFPNQN